MGDGCLHILSAPAQRQKELVELQLADGLKAEPLGTDVTGVLVLQGLRVYMTLSLRTARLVCLADDVEAALPHHLAPVLQGTLPDAVGIDAQRVGPQLRLILMLVLVGQRTRDVAHLPQAGDRQRSPRSTEYAYSCGPAHCGRTPSGGSSARRDRSLGYSVSVK